MTLLLLRVLLRVRRSRHLIRRRKKRDGGGGGGVWRGGEDAIDLAPLAAAFDALVGEVVHRHDVGRHLEVGGGEGGLVLHCGDAGFEGFDFVDVVAVLVALIS